MPRYYVDLDNNRLVTGPQSTQLAPTPRLYQGDKPTLDVELLTRTNGVLGYYTSTASAINVRVGTQGGTAVASALTLSVVTLSAAATATAGLTSAVTATGTATLLGSVTAAAVAVLNSPTDGLITATVSSLAHGSAKAVVRNGQVVEIAIPSCGRYSTVPSIVISQPDVLVRTDRIFAGNVNQSVTLVAAGAGSERVLNIILSVATGNTSVPTVRAFYTDGGEIGAAIFTGINQVETVMTASTAGTSNYFSGQKNSQLNLSLPETHRASATFETVALSSAAAQAELVAGKISDISMTAAGGNYYLQPDVWIVPSPEDFNLAAPVTVTAATASGRNISCTVASGHGFVEGDYLQSIGLYHESHSWSASGVWSVTSALSTSVEFRIATLHVHPQHSVALTTTSASLQKILLKSYVSSVSITSAGSGFSSSDQVVTIASADCAGRPAVVCLGVSSQSLASAHLMDSGLGFAASSITAAVPAYKSIDSITITCAGSGYWETVPTVSVNQSAFVATAPGAVTASVVALLNGNGQISLRVSQPGYGYTTTPTLTIDPPNRGNGVRRVAVVTRGVGYSSGTFACDVSAAPAGGTDAVVNFVVDGSAQSFTVVNPGRGYTSAPAVTVPAPDLGGQVSGFTITSAGAGYVDAPAVTLTGGGGTGAAATAILTNGTVTSISLDSQGSGYTSAPTVTLSAPPSSVFYSKQIDLSGASVTTLLGGNSSGSAFLQVEERQGSDTTVLAQLPLIIQARVS